MIRIEKTERGNTYYKYDYDTFLEMSNKIRTLADTYDRCVMCNCWLDYTYVYMIKTLKKNNLLEENYTLFCCECYRDWLE